MKEPNAEHKVTVHVVRGLGGPDSYEAFCETCQRTVIWIAHRHLAVAAAKAHREGGTTE